MRRALGGAAATSLFVAVALVGLAGGSAVHSTRLLRYSYDPGAARFTIRVDRTTDAWIAVDRCSLRVDGGRARDDAEYVEVRDGTVPSQVCTFAEVRPVSSLEASSVVIEGALGTDPRSSPVRASCATGTRCAGDVAVLLGIRS